MHDEHLADVLSRRSPGRSRDGADTSGERMLPDSGEGYLAHARPSNNPVYTLHCLLGKEGYRSFQYVHLDSDSRFAVDGKGQVISLRFCASKTMAVTIRGRNLGRLYDYLHQHRMPWIMRVDSGRDFGADHEPVILAVEIAEVTYAEIERSI